MKKLICFAIFYQIIILQAQDLSGQWQGILTQPGKADTFFYQIDIVQKGKSLSGASYSRTPDGKASGRFTLTGFWDGTQLILQEIEQTEPQNGGWCLKYATLQFRTEDGFDVLAGDWKADRCSPGKLLLRRQSSMKEVIKEEEAPFAWSGRWTGHLSQSDRDYGFFYELTLVEDGTGQSYIVSEDNGGSAYHDLTWKFNTGDSTFALTESAVASKTDSRWKWCIKSASLRLRREGSRFILEGNWEGFLEGYTTKTGKCAPGIVYLEKPVTTKEVRQFEAQQSQTYEAQEHREVRVSRVVEVQKPNIRIKVWDSGTVDGDVVTLFLNGKKILDKYRVNKSQLAIPVTLNDKNNFLILHAEDLGSIPPNTIAVSVDDGSKEQRIVLSSDLKTSGAILVRQFKIE